MTALLQALCCSCGNLRTCRRPRNHRGENLWLRSPVDLDWHRETGDLKCDECGRITNHAILLPNDSLRDHAEKLRKAGTGWHYKGQDMALAQQRWHQSQQNPRLHHLWWVSDERAAREAGHATMPAICKAQIPVPEHTHDEREERGTCNSYKREQVVAPRNFDSDEDIDGWRRIDCVDCYNRSNTIALEEQCKQLEAQRKDVHAKILAASLTLENLNEVDLAALGEFLDRHLKSLRGGRD